jgi:alkylhydroperoxidase/carboxymuconolactone decarboxylase family protein YurZ
VKLLEIGFRHIFFEILRDQHAVRAQLAGAKNIGVTKGEVEEALRVTFLLSGMPAYLYGKAQLDEVMP